MYSLLFLAVIFGTVLTSESLFKEKFLSSSSIDSSEDSTSLSNELLINDDTNTLHDMGSDKYKNSNNINSHFLSLNSIRKFIDDIKYSYHRYVHSDFTTSLLQSYRNTIINGGSKIFTSNLLTPSLRTNRISTKIITSAPTYNPTRSPTLIPTAQPSHNESQPSSSPTQIPTAQYQFSTTYKTFQITSGGTYSFKGFRKQIIINTPDPVTVTGNGGINHYKILPIAGGKITVTDFDTNTDLFDLLLFSGIEDISNVGYSTNPLTLLLTDNQRVILPNYKIMTLSIENFIFIIPSSTITTTSSSTDDGHFVFWSSDLISAVSVLTILVFLVLFFNVFYNKIKRIMKLEEYANITEDKEEQDEEKTRLVRTGKKTQQSENGQSPTPFARKRDISGQKSQLLTKEALEKRKNMKTVELPKKTTKEQLIKDLEEKDSDDVNTPFIKRQEPISTKNKTNQDKEKDEEKNSKRVAEQRKTIRKSKIKTKTQGEGEKVAGHSKLLDNASLVSSATSYSPMHKNYDIVDVAIDNFINDDDDEFELGSDWDFSLSEEAEEFQDLV